MHKPPSSMKCVEQEVHDNGPAPVYITRNQSQQSILYQSMTHHYTFYNNDGIFGIQILFWRSLRDILDDIHRLLTSIHLDISHIDLVSGRYTYHSSNNISRSFHDHYNSCLMINDNSLMNNWWEVMRLLSLSLYMRGREREGLNERERNFIFIIASADKTRT